MGEPEDRPASEAASSGRRRRAGKWAPSSRSSSISSAPAARIRIRRASRLIRSSRAQESGSSTCRSSVRSRSSCSACSYLAHLEQGRRPPEPVEPTVDLDDRLQQLEVAERDQFRGAVVHLVADLPQAEVVIRVGGADQAAAPGQRIALVFQDDDGPAGIREVPDDVAVAQGESSTEGQARGEHARLAQCLGPVDHEVDRGCSVVRGGCGGRRRPARTAGLRWSRASRTAPPRPVGPRSRLAPRRRREAGRLRRGSRQRAARRAGPDPASGWPSALRTPT